LNKVVVAATLVLLATIGFSAYAYTVYLPNYGHPGSSSPGGSTTGLGSPGTVSIYLTDAPPGNPALKYMLVNVTSVTLIYASANAMTTTTTSSSTSSMSSSSTLGSSSVTTSMTGSSSSTSTTSSSSSSDPQSTFVFDVASNVGTNLNITKLQGSSVLLGETQAPAGDVVKINFNIDGARAYWTDGSSTQLKVVADGKLMIPVHFTIMSDGSTNLNIDLTPNTIHISQGNASVLTPVIHVNVVSSGPTTTETTEATTTESETSSST
jgi:trimeric autotransporter adhesin